MTGFTLFMFWLGACWLVGYLVSKPLQPDQLTDDLGDLDVDAREFQVALKNQAWMDRPVINLRLSGRWVK